jgi:hypothetical protein
MKGLKTPLERRYGVATDFISTEKRIRARRISNRGESSRTSNPAPFTKRRVRLPASFDRASVHYGAARKGWPPATGVGSFTYIFAAEPSWSASLLNVGNDRLNHDRFDGQFEVDTLGDRVGVG